MDLIPVLSTIVLVATLATLIFSITAYVIYKVKERRVGKLPPSGVPRRGQISEHMAPPPVQVPRAPMPPIETPVLTPSVRLRPERLSFEQGEEVPTGVSQESSAGPGTAQLSFWVYTPQGYVPLSALRRAEALRWR